MGLQNKHKQKQKVAFFWCWLSPNTSKSILTVSRETGWWNICVHFSGKKMFAFTFSELSFAGKTADEPAGKNKEPDLCLQIWFSHRASCWSVRSLLSVTDQGTGENLPPSLLASQHLAPSSVAWEGCALKVHFFFSCLKAKQGKIQ